MDIEKLKTFFTSAGVNLLMGIIILVVGLFVVHWLVKFLRKSKAFSKLDPSLQSFFINGRYIKSKTASAALEQAYASRIPADKFPFCVLNIELNPAAVDVNVHPAKLEVKFANEKLIHGIAHIGEHICIQLFYF